MNNFLTRKPYRVPLGHSLTRLLKKNRFWVKRIYRFFLEILKKNLKLLVFVYYHKNHFFLRFETLTFEFLVFRQNVIRKDYIREM